MDKLNEQDHYSNFNRKNKWLGIIDYKSLIILLVILFAIWNMLGIFIKKEIQKLYIIIVVSIPFLGLFYANRNSEDLSHIVYIAIRYIVSYKKYVYKIETNKQWLK